MLGGNKRRSRLIKRWAVHDKTGDCRSQAWRDIRASRYPTPVQTGSNWYEGHVTSLFRAICAPTAG
jgi:predicted DNA-binding transcriptional regulator AlpA